MEAVYVCRKFINLYYSQYVSILCKKCYRQHATARYSRSGNVYFLTARTLTWFACEILRWEHLLILLKLESCNRHITDRLWTEHTAHRSDRKSQRSPSWLQLQRCVLGHDSFATEVHAIRRGAEQQLSSLNVPAGNKKNRKCITLSPGIAPWLQWRKEIASLIAVGCDYDV